LIRNEGVQFSIRGGGNIPWMKIDPGVNLPWGPKYQMTLVDNTMAKNDKRTNNDLQNIHIKLKIE
jgi:hypothetical protein